MRPKPEVGQTVYLLEYGRLDKYDVVRVGRKFFYILLSESGSRREKRVRLDTWRVDLGWGSPPQVYASEQEYRDELAQEMLTRKLRGLFDPYRSVMLPLATLRKIKAIVDAETEAENG